MRHKSLSYFLNFIRAHTKIFVFQSLSNSSTSLRNACPLTVTFSEIKIYASKEYITLLNLSKNFW